MSESALFVVDDGDLRKYRAEIPNMVCDMELGPHAGWLYVHLKRVAGDKGVCWKSTRTLAKATGMSVGAVSQAKNKLKDHGLIDVTEGDRKKGESDEIRVANIWQRNFVHCDGRDLGPRSQYEHPDENPRGEGVHNMNTPFTSRTPRSQYEPKKEPLEVPKESLSNERPKNPTGSPPRKVKRLTDEEAENRFAKLCDGDEHGDALREMSELMAADNKTGEVAMTRVWREIGARYLANRKRYELTNDAWAYGFQRALAANAPNIGWVTKAARGYSPDSPGVRTRARNSIAVVGAKDEDYNEEDYRFHA